MSATTKQAAFELAESLTFDWSYGAEFSPGEPMSDWHRDATGYRITLRLLDEPGGRAVAPGYAFNYFQGPLITRDPRLSDVLSCLALDARIGRQSHAEFCADLRVDEDSLAGYRSWQTCVDRADDLVELFGGWFETFVETDWEALARRIDDDE